MTIQALYEDFNNNYIQYRLKPSTERGYKVNFTKHIIPYIGDKDICEITVTDLDKLQKTISTFGLSSKSCLYVHAVLRKAYNYAIKRGYVSKTPYDSFDLPKQKRFPIQPLEPDDARRLLELCKGTSLEIPITMALCYGLRRGECLGIIPSKDLCASRSILKIQRTRGVENGKTVVTDCKTETSNREILLDKSHVEMLQASAKGDDYACGINPNVLDKQYHRFLKANNFPNIRFHDLRHTYATITLNHQVNPKIVSTVLGHSSIKVTLDIYCHPSVREQQACIDVMKSI